MSYNELQAIDFEGGPLDGHADVFALPLPALVCFQSARLTKQTPWFQRITQLFSGRFSTPFLVATYELQLYREDLVYRYLSSSLATEQVSGSGSVWLLDNEYCEQAKVLKLPQQQ